MEDEEQTGREEDTVALGGEGKHAYRAGLPTWEEAT